MIRNLARACAKAGDTVEVVCQDDPDAPWLAGYPCPVHALGRRGRGRYRLSLHLRKWLGENTSRFDGVVTQGIGTFSGVVVRATARRAGKPYCVFSWGAFGLWFNRRYPLQHIKKLFYRLFLHPVLRDASAVFFASAPELEFAKASVRPNLWNGVLFPPAICEPEGNPTSEIEAFYQFLPALRNRRYLLFLARIHEKKGCDMLIEAFARIASFVVDLDLVMAGPDPVGWQAKLQRMAGDLGVARRIHWPGVLSGDQKWGALRAADAFILPSHQENFAIATMEALAARRPVLITHQVSIWQEIQGEGAGLVDNDTVDGIERLLRRWLDMPQTERHAMAERAYPCFLRRYALKDGATVINRIFREAKQKNPADIIPAG